MYNVYNNNLAWWFTSYIEGLQVLMSSNIANFFIAEGIMSSNVCGKIEGMIFMSSDIFEQINIG